MAKPRFRWFRVADATKKRQNPRCELLEDGRVRLIGGTTRLSESPWTQTVANELYAPEEDRWYPDDSESVAVASLVADAMLENPEKSRLKPTFTKLRDGNVLMTGGYIDYDRSDGDSNRTSCKNARLYDQSLKKWVDAGELPTGTHNHGVVQLASGAVLVCCGEFDERGETTHTFLGVPEALSLDALGPALEKRLRRVLERQLMERRIEKVEDLCDDAKFRAALSKIETLAKEFPEHADVQRLLGKVYSGLERFEDAIVPLQKAIAADPDDPFVLVECADAHYYAGKSETAKELYERALASASKDPDFAEVLRPHIKEALKTIAVASGDRKAATKKPEEDGTSLEWNNTGVAFSQKGQNKRARAAFERAVQLDPKNSYAWGNLAGVLCALKEPEAALEAAEKMLEHTKAKTRTAEVLNVCGIALFDLGRYEASLAAYDKALARKDLAHVWNNRGNTLCKLERFDEAMESYQRSAKGNYANGHWGVAEMYTRNKAFEQARVSVKNAIALDPSIASAMKACDELAAYWAWEKRNKRK